MPAVSPSSVSVLILEDQEADFELVTRELKRAGFTIRPQRAETEEEFRVQLQASPDIILSDYVLGLRFNALSALEVLQESGLDVPLIVLTGVVSEETVVECMKRGAADYLMARIAGEPALEVTEVPFSIIVRGSVGPPPKAGRKAARRLARRN